jgi:saccharopine dehydrogenase-like NADP-dependent oxidoreductase
MRTLVLGASGQIGAYTVQDLVEFYKADVTAASRKLSNVKKAMTDLNLAEHVKLAELDANDTQAVATLARNERIDTVVNCAWYQTNLSVMDACVRAGAQYTDLGGLFDTTLKQLQLTQKWKDANLNATIGLGSTPGLTNIAGAAGAAKFENVDTINIYCTWGNTLPVKEPGWPGYSTNSDGRIHPRTGYLARWQARETTGSIGRDNYHHAGSNWQDHSLLCKALRTCNDGQIHRKRLSQRDIPDWLSKH